MIKPTALSEPVRESFVIAHDYIKLLIAQQNLEKIAKITRPQIFQEIKTFIDETNQAGLKFKPIRDNDNSYTTIEHFVKYDQLFGVPYNENNFDKYNITNMFRKKFFKKILYTTPKAGIFKMTTFSSVIVVDVMFSTNVKVILVDPATDGIVYGTQEGLYEKCLIEFTTKTKYKKKPMILDYEDESVAKLAKENILNGWKISNINRVIDLPNHENIFDAPSNSS